MSRPGLSTASVSSWRERARDRLEQLTPRQRQFGLLAAALAGGIALLWLVFSLSSEPPKARPTGPSDAKTSVNNIGVLPPGAQVNPVDQWVGTAGRKLAQYESEREEQGRLNKDRQSFEARTMQRFAELEQKLTSAQQGTATPAPTPGIVPSGSMTPTMPPASALPPTSYPARPIEPATPITPNGMPPGTPIFPSEFSNSPAATPLIVRVSLAPRDAGPSGGDGAAIPPAATATPNEAKSVSTFLPVSFTRGTLLGGLDAPTGGQSQTNPHPVLIRLSDNSMLPNRFRGEYRDCFVIAAGYGDISSERAYLRTESLSCVRSDGATLEVRIQGSVYGEDGKVGMRGRLVTKQGQMLANALLAGVVSGIGQGLSTANTTYSTTPLGSTASTDSNADAFRAGIGSGVGKALDRLAQYYIKLAENTFPVIEVDAGREIDVVITKGVRIDVPMSPAAADGSAPRRAGANARITSPETRYLEVARDDQY